MEIEGEEEEEEAGNGKRSNEGAGCRTNVPIARSGSGTGKMGNATKLMGQFHLAFSKKYVCIQPDLGAVFYLQRRNVT